MKKTKAPTPVRSDGTTNTLILLIFFINLNNYE